ncbi:MAG: MGMT family protein [Eubacteriales bacterium]|nr:MGMT family protein [Eubacteriales bacterium]
MDFYKRVEMVCKEIPFGRVATYGQIALLCGKPANARQVGYALGHRLTRDDIPAHRVVNGQGYLSGAGAFAVSGLQAMLLEKEGVEVTDGQRVDLKKYGWKHTLEDAERFRACFHSDNGEKPFWAEAKPGCSQRMD